MLSITLLSLDCQKQLCHRRCAIDLEVTDIIFDMSFVIDTYIYIYIYIYMIHNKLPRIDP